jgi:hypothetical protein
LGAFTLGWVGNNDQFPPDLKRILGYARDAEGKRNNQIGERNGSRMISLEDVSPRELLERVHAKIQEKHAVLLPAIAQKIQGQKDLKDSSNEKDEGKSGISLVDLFHVLGTGALITVEAASNGWEVILQGVTYNGENLFISAYLSNKISDPLQINNFGSVQKSFMKVVATLSNEEQATTQEFIDYLRRKSPSSDTSFQAALDSFVREHSVLLQNLAH